jgi:hypothetical protein
MSDWWVGKPWRMIQTNLREIDMMDIDAERFVSYLQEFKATAVLINSAGIIASYPTKLPFHFQSPFLQGDSLEDIITACHAAGIRVLARTDFSKVRRPLYEAHPEWAYLSPRGEIIDYNGDVHVCINGAYQQEYVPRIIEELVTTHEVDGIFFNMAGYQVRDYSGNYYGICHCHNCRREFWEMYGLALPEAEELDDSVYRRYLLFKKRTLRAYHDKIYSLIQRLRPELCIANHLEFGRGIVRQESNTGIDRPLPRWQYSASDNTKWAVSSYPSMISSNTTVDFIDFPYRHVAVSPHQQKLRLAQNLANGGGLDYYLIGRLDNHEDRSGYAGIREMFHYHAAHEGEYLDLTSKAPIGLLGQRREGNQAEFRGWFRFLVEGHFLFDTIIVDRALELPWDRYQALILPDLQPISDTLAQKLDQFAADGGTVISVSRSGFRDGDYELRGSPALKCLGIDKVSMVRPNMRSAYFKMDDKEGFGRFPATDLLYMDGHYIYAEYGGGVDQRFKLIPPHMFGPPERCYYTQVTEHPAFTVHRFGRGMGITIPWEPGGLYWRQGHINTFDFAADLLEHIVGLEPVGGDLSPMVEATVFERADRSYQLLHLVNGSGHFGVTFFAPVSMTDIEVSVRYEGSPSSVRSLVTGEDYGFRVEGDALAIMVPRLELFEAIKVAR